MSPVRWSTIAVAAMVGTASADEVIAEVELGAVEDVESFALSALLEQPVTAASGYAAKPSDSPTLVSTVDHDTIDRFGYRTVREALMGLRGVYVGNDRNYSYLGARGFSIPGDYNTRFALSIDNHRVNDPVYGQASIGAELGLPMIAIERIELVRGGAWSVHGESALLGAVQIVTATGASRPGLHVSSTTRATKESFDDPAGRDGTSSRGEDVAASYGAVAKGLDVFVAGAYSYDPGVPALYMPDLASTTEPCVDARGALKVCDGVVSGHDGEEVGSTYASLRSKHVSAHVLASRRHKHVPTASFGTLIGAGVETTDDRVFADVQATHSTPRFDIVGRLAADYFKYHGSYPIADAELASGTDGIGRVETRDSGTGRSVTGEVRGRYRWPTVGEHLTDLELAAGVEGSIASAAQWGTTYYPASSETYIDRSDSDRIASVFGHAATRAFDHVVGFAAVRGDYHPDSFGLAVNPQLGIVLDGGDVGRLRVSVSRGYRAPTPYERFYATAYGLPPANLEAERSQTREVSIERYLGTHVRVLAVGFHQTVENSIVVSGDEAAFGAFINGGGVHAYGAELEVEGRWDRLALSASYARQHVGNDNETMPTNAPQSLASLRLLAPIAGGHADVGVESFFVNKRYAFDGSVIEPLFTTNAVLTVRDLVKSLDLSFGITNLFDERSGDPGSEEHRQSRIPRDPRTLWLRVSVGLDP